jgi:hypothetical protein
MEYNRYAYSKFLKYQKRSTNTNGKNRKNGHFKFTVTVQPRYKVPQYNGNLDIKEVFASWIKDVVWLSKMPLFLS